MSSGETVKYDCLDTCVDSSISKGGVFLEHLCCINSVLFLTFSLSVRQFFFFALAVMGILHLTW